MNMLIQVLMGTGPKMSIAIRPKMDSTMLNLVSTM
jgi:hypothetical protein